MKASPFLIQNKDFEQLLQPRVAAHKDPGRVRIYTIKAPRRPEIITRTR